MTQEVQIPNDLKELYELSKRAKLAGREMVYCGLIERTGRAEATSAELLRLLERHHASMTAVLSENSPYGLLYSDTELYRDTEAAIKHAKEQP